jgi:hypothetical protein
LLLPDSKSYFCYFQKLLLPAGARWDRAYFRLGYNPELLLTFFWKVWGGAGKCSPKYLLLRDHLRLCLGRKVSSLTEWTGGLGRKIKLSEGGKWANPTLGRSKVLRSEIPRFQCVFVEGRGKGAVIFKVRIPVLNSLLKGNENLPSIKNVMRNVSLRRTCANPNCLRCMVLQTWHKLSIEGPFYLRGPEEPG